MITFYSEDITLPAIDQAKVSDWIRRVAATYGKRTGDISYIFCSDEKIPTENGQGILATSSVRTRRFSR